jgi:membrane protease YdiL (CAAX protease family)
LLSFLALGIATIDRVLTRREFALTPAGFWIANIVAAVLFGLGHLPVTARLVPLTSVVVTRAIALNGIVGLVAGYLFWRRGIEMAIACHFSADIVLHVAAPLLQSWLLRGR